MIFHLCWLADTHSMIGDLGNFWSGVVRMESVAVWGWTLTVPLLVALWRGLEKRMDELKRCTRECVTRSECESKYDGLAKAIGLMLKPMNEKLDKLSNGGSIDSLRAQVAANAEKIAVLRSQAGTD